jgi:hypothetical protein
MYTMFRSVMVGGTTAGDQGLLDMLFARAGAPDNNAQLLLCWLLIIGRPLFFISLLVLIMVSQLIQGFCVDQ